MNLKEQQYICVLAECGSITRAAERLYISQPALSIYISNIEKGLGVKLFDRIGKKFVLTASGEIYVNKAKQMLTLQDEFEHDLNDLKNFKTGTITCGVQLRRAPFLLPPVLSKFRLEYPNINVVIKEGVRTDLESFLGNNQIQILIDNMDCPREDLVSIPLYRDFPLIALPAGHPLNKEAKPKAGQIYKHMDLALFKDEFFILPTKKQSLRFYLDKVFSEFHMDFINYMEIRNFDTAMQLVAEGYGIGFNREQYARSMRYDKPVNFYTFGNNAAGVTQVYALHQKGLSLPPYMERFLELLTQYGKKIESGFSLPNSR